MKNILIFGDSYSTYEGFVPDGYRYYYSSQGRAEGPPVTKMKVEETWWWQAVTSVNGTLLLNNSWSGSTIGYTGREGDCSHSSSFIYRFRQLREEHFFEKNEVDTVFVFGGTNDSWVQAPLGEMKLSDWEEKDLHFVLPAICHFMSVLKKELPKAAIYFLINTGLKEEIVACMKKAGAHYHVETIELVDIEKENGHPNAAGMKTICDQVLRAVASKVK